MITFCAHRLLVRPYHQELAPSEVLEQGGPASSVTFDTSNKWQTGMRPARGCAEDQAGGGSPKQTFLFFSFACLLSWSISLCCPLRFSYRLILYIVCTSYIRIQSINHPIGFYQNSGAEGEGQGQNVPGQTSDVCSLPCWMRPLEGHSVKSRKHGFMARSRHSFPIL